MTVSRPSVLVKNSGRCRTYEVGDGECESRAFAESYAPVDEKFMKIAIVKIKKVALKFSAS